MARRLLLGIFGLLGLGLWVPQGCAGGPAAPYRLAQVQKKAPATSPSASPANNEALEVDRVAQSTKVSASPDRSRLFSVRVSSSPTYSRVTMDLSHEVRYETHRLKEDPSKGLPPRIYVDLFTTKLAMDARNPIAVDDGVLRQLRVGQFTADVVRIVIDLTTLGEHNAFLLADPYRLVIDIQGQKSSEPVVAADKSKKKTATLPEKGKAASDSGHPQDCFGSGTRRQGSWCHWCRGNRRKRHCSGCSEKVGTETQARNGSGGGSDAKG